MLCVCGDEYLICLIQNNEGKGNIYAKGINNNYQCGLNGENISSLTKIEMDDNLDFKSINTYKGISAAITSCGKLFVWGLISIKNKKSFLMKTPILVNKNEDNNSILIDSISLKYDYIYILGRKIENGNYFIFRK